MALPFRMGENSPIVGVLLKVLHGQRFSAIMSLTIRLKVFLFAVISCRTFNVHSGGFDSMFCCMLISDRSFSINFTHVVGGLPTFFFAFFRLSLRAFFARVSLFRHIRWPSQLNPLLLIVVLHDSDSVFCIVHHY